MAVLPSMRKPSTSSFPIRTRTVQPANSKSRSDRLEISPGGKYAINSEAVTRDRLPRRLKEIYDRAEKDHFRKGVPGVKYGDIIDAMDVARCGVKIIGFRQRTRQAGTAADARAK
jgi:biopolymer transport protein ExbD